MFFDSFLLSAVLKKLHIITAKWSAHILSPLRLREEHLPFIFNMIPNEMVPGVVLALSRNMGALIRNVCRLFAKVWFLKCGKDNFPFSFRAIMWKPWGWAMPQTVRHHNNGPVCTHAIQNVWAYFGNMCFHAASPLETVLIHQILDILFYFFFNTVTAFQFALALCVLNTNDIYCN